MVGGSVGLVSLLALCNFRVWVLCGANCMFRELEGGDLVVSSKVVYANGNLIFNPSTLNRSTSVLYSNYTLNGKTPWRLQFIAKLDSCSGSPFPITVDSKLSILIESGNRNCSTCSVLSVLFDFNSNSVPFLQLLQNSRVLKTGTDPTSSSEWSQINGSICGRTFDTILDFNGTTLSLLLGSSIPWFVYPINIPSTLKSQTDKIVLGWKFATNSMRADLVISNVTVHQDCSFYPPKLRNKQCTTTKASVSPSSFSINNGQSTFSKGTLYLASTNISTSSWYRKKVDITSGWNVSFDMYVHDCALLSGCFGDGIAFVLQNEGSGLQFVSRDTQGSQLGFMSVANQNLFGITMDFFGYCKTVRALTRIEYYTPTSHATSVVYNPSKTFVCPSSFKVGIQFNRTHILFSLNGTVSITKTDFTKLILDDNKKGYLGLTLGNDVARIRANITNILISQYSTECNYIPNPPPLTWYINLICRGNQCETINQTSVTLVDGTYFLPNTLLDHLSILVDTQYLLSLGNLSINASTLYLNSDTSVDLQSGSTLSLTQSNIYISGSNTLSSSQKVNIQNVTIHIDLPQITSTEMVLIESKDTIIVASNTTIQIAGLDCSDVKITKSSVLLQLDKCQNQGLTLIMIIIIASVVGGVLLIGLIICFCRYRMMKKALDGLEVNTKWQQI